MFQQGVVPDGTEWYLAHKPPKFVWTGKHPGFALGGICSVRRKVRLCAGREVTQGASVQGFNGGGAFSGEFSMTGRLSSWFKRRGGVRIVGLPRKGVVRGHPHVCRRKRGNINTAALVTTVQCNTLVARCSRQLIGPADWVFVTLRPLRCD